MRQLANTNADCEGFLDQPLHIQREPLSETAIRERLLNWWILRGSSAICSLGGRVSPASASRSEESNALRERPERSQPKAPNRKGKRKLDRTSRSPRSGRFLTACREDFALSWSRGLSGESSSGTGSGSCSARSLPGDTPHAKPRRRRSPGGAQGPRIAHGAPSDWEDCLGRVGLVTVRPVGR
jgi:hypothetical protein